VRKEASASFLKKRSKKLLLIAGVCAFGAKASSKLKFFLLRSFELPAFQTVMARLDRAIHAFSTAEAFGGRCA
jgi:hypothetical protein